MVVKFIKFLFKAIVIALVTLGGSFVVMYPFVKYIAWNMGLEEITFQLTSCVWMIAWGIKLTKAYMNFEWLFGGKDDKSGCKCNSECK